MSKASRLARPASTTGPVSKLALRKECPGGAANGSRARVVSVGEKLMRAGSDGVVAKQKALAPATAPLPQEKAAASKPQPETLTTSATHGQAGSGANLQGPSGEVVPPQKSRLSPPKVSAHHQGGVQKQNKSNLKVTSPEDAEHLGRRQASPNGTSSPPSRAADPKASRTVPRRHTVGGARSARDILAMQPPEMDKKREAFLEHLKQKYPHHASAIMGHQERLREQCLQGMLSSLHSELDFQRYLVKLQLHHRSRSPKHGPSPSPSPSDQVDHLSLASLESLDTMSETDAPSAFTRGSRVRASLPVVRSTNQTKDRSLGVLYLQYGDETKQIRMPNEITSGDTVRALFVGAFPQQLTMKMLESPSVAVYVKDDMRNMYYELTDVRNITDHSCLKVYHKDPAQAFSHGPRPSNGDARMHREMIYGQAPHPLRQPPMGPAPHHPMQGSMSPPMPHSMPPSPSRIPFGPRQASIPGSATMPRDRMPNANPPARSVSPCPSAILERRDVKPDEDMGGSGKSHSLTRGNEAHYADPYLLQEGRMAMASAHGPHPPPPGLDGPEHGLGGYHRASIRSTGSSGGYGGPSPTDTMDHPSLYRQKSRNSQLPTLGSKTPPPSPHRMTEMRMIDIHGGPPHGGPPHGGPPHGGPPHGGPPHGGPPHGGPPHGGPPHGGPPHGGPPHGGPPHGGPPHGGPPHGGPPHGGPPHGGPPHGGPPHGGPPHGGPPHGGPPHGGPPHGGPPHGGPPHGGPPHAVPLERCSPVRQSFRKEEGAGGAKPRNNVAPSPPVGDLQGHVPGQAPQANDPQTRERMRAMEQQIASLTGLVQHALLKGPNSSGTKEPLSDRPPKTSSPAHSAHSAHSSGGSPVLAPKSSTAPPVERGPVPLQVNLMHCKRNVSDLRLQLQQMRQLQLHNQEALCVQLKHTEQEISVKLAEAMRRAEDPVQRQRALVEEDRHKYLGLEERVLTQLSDLEQFVDSLKRDSGGTARAVTLKDVEEGAVTLRKVGESLAGLKGEFPTLQTRMRAVLRVEVEAVKFLKEEPHKLDTMLKRVKSLTETLSSLRRCATEINQKASDQPTSVSLKAAPVETGPTVASEPGPVHVVDATPASASAQPEPQTSTLRSEVMPSSPVIIHHVQSSPVHMQQSQQSAALTTQPSPPLTPSPTQGASPCPGPGQSQSQSQGRESPKAAASDPPSPVRSQKASVNPINNGSQILVIEELQSSQGKGKSRAMSIEAAEREWEEKRQNMGHYDGKEFAKILQEAQVNMMKGIPSLDMEEKSTAPPAATGDQTDSPNPVETASDEPQPSPTTEKPAKPVPEKPPKPVLEKPAKPILERPTKACAERTPATKPAVSSEKVAKLGSEKASKSPPPPPPRKTYPSSSSGMTTTRSGEVVYTSRKDSLSAQEGEEEGPPPSPQSKPAMAPPETLPKSPTPPPVTASAVTEEEDEGDKIMAELQVFQKCSVKDVGVKNVADPAATRIEPQIRELRPGALLPLKEKKSSEPSREDKEPNIDENGNTTVRQSQGVIYYVTGQISKDQPPPPPPGTEETPERREPTLPPSQVSNVNANDNSPGQQQPLSDPPVSPPPVSPPPISPPPISPKPVGLNGFKLPRKHMKRSQSTKTSAEAPGANTILNQINAEKKRETSVTQEHISSSKSVVTEKVSISTTGTLREAPKSVVPPPEEASCDGGDQARGHFEMGDEDAGLSADLPGEEAPPPPDNIAFMITNTKVQALSCGEYQELVNAKKGSVQTVTVGNRGNATGNAVIDPSAPPDHGFNRRPVIIIFDEPMDIRSAYKRLSTIFESEEELERMLAEERIEEESEESDTERSGGTQVMVGGPKGGDDGSAKAVGRRAAADRNSLSSSSSSSSVSELTEGGANSETTGDAKQDGKKKFKFKFPKKQLAALSQAIRAGTKSGKKTLQVVVYEDEEESDGTVRQHKEAKRFEIVRAKSQSAPGSAPAKRDNSDSLYRTDEIRKNTYKTLDSLEQTIKQLETTISEMGPCSQQEPHACVVEEIKAGNDNASEGVGLKRSLSLPSSKSAGSKICLPSKSSLRKKSKPQLLPRPVVIPTTTTTSTPSPPSSIQQNASVASPTSRMPVPLSAKSRQSPGTTDKAGKPQKLQDAQRQFRQANGSAKRVGGDHKTTSPTIPASKIPAFYTSSSKGSSQPAQNSDATNSINPSFSSSPSPSPSSSATKSSSLPSPYAPRSVSSHIPSLSNGSLKLPTPSHQHTGKTLSFSSQTQNGRAHSSSSSSSFSSSSSSSPSPLSPTPLGPGGKSIRTIHTPSFTSYRPHNGAGGGKSCIPTATAAKDTI